MTAVHSEVAPRATVASGRIIAALLLFAASAGLLAAALGSSAQPTQAVVWGGLALAAYAAGFIPLVGSVRGAGLGIARWQLGSWTLVWYSIAFGLATVTWSQPQSGTPTQIALSSVLRALWLIAVGMTVWATGYLAGPGLPARRLAERVVEALGRRFGPDVRSPLAPWILYAIGTAARLVGAAASGRFGYVGDAASAVSTASGYQQILSLLALCSPLAVAAAALQVYRERLPGARITLAVLFAAELVFGAAAGGKQNFVIAVLAVAVPFSAARRRLPRASLIFFLIIFVTVVIPFTQGYRDNARTSAGTPSAAQAVAAGPGILGQTVNGSALMSDVPSSVSYLLQRIREIDSSAIILQRTPQQIAYFSPIRLVEEPIASLVPRAVWPAKPILASGYDISQKYYDLPPTVYTSSAISQSADLYRYGGWVPVLVGMFLLGCAVRLLDDVLDVQANPHAIFLVLLLFPALVKNEEGWVSILAGIPGTVLIWLLAVSLVFRRWRTA